jgi:hypothetical protein
LPPVSFHAHLPLPPLVPRDSSTRKLLVDKLRRPDNHIWPRCRAESKKASVNTLCGIQMPTRPVPVDELTSLRFSMVVSATQEHYNTISYVGPVGHVRLDPLQTVVGVNLVSDTFYWTELPVYSPWPCKIPSDSDFHAACSSRCRAESKKASVKPQTKAPDSSEHHTTVTLSDPLPQDDLHTFDWGRRPDPRDKADQHVMLALSQVQ